MFFTATLHIEEDLTRGKFFVNKLKNFLIKLFSDFPKDTFIDLISSGWTKGTVRNIFKIIF